MLNLDIGSFHCIDATAVVLVLFQEPPTLPTYHLPGGAAAITPQHLSCDHLAVFLQCFDNFKLADLLPSSPSHQLQLYNNPLKPQGAEETDEFTLESLGNCSSSPTACNSCIAYLGKCAGEVTLQDADGNALPPPVSHYIPLDLWDCNIGTNAGFNETLDRLDEFYSVHEHSEHVYVVADVNIYWRYHRVTMPQTLLAVLTHTHLLAMQRAFKQQGHTKKLTD